MRICNSSSFSHLGMERRDASYGIGTNGTRRWQLLPRNYGSLPTMPLSLWMGFIADLHSTHLFAHGSCWCRITDVDQAEGVPGRCYGQEKCINIHYHFLLGWLAILVNLSWNSDCLAVSTTFEINLVSHLLRREKWLRKMWLSKWHLILWWNRHVCTRRVYRQYDKTVRSTKVRP